MDWNYQFDGVQDFQAVYQPEWGVVYPIMQDCFWYHQKNLDFSTATATQFPSRMLSRPWATPMGSSAASWRIKNISPCKVLECEPIESHPTLINHCFAVELCNSILGTQRQPKLPGSQIAASQKVLNSYLSKIINPQLMILLLYVWPVWM